MFGVIEVAAPTAEALEACRLAIEQIVGFAVSPHAPSRVLLDLRADSPLLGKLRADRYAIASRVRASCRLMELEVPGRDNSFECVAAVGTLDNCLAARDMLAAELQLGALAAEVEGGMGGGSVACYAPPPRFNLKAPLPIRKVLFFPEQADEPGPYHPESGPEEESLSTLQVFLKYLDSACESIDACVFNITDDRIARRLLDAHRHRGVRVRVITDVEQQKGQGSDAERIRQAGIALRYDLEDKYHMHHKVRGRVKGQGVNEPPPARALAPAGLHAA